MTSIFKIEQYVCKICGFNMIEYLPDYCPFCGSSKTNFITAEECAQNYKVIKSKVSSKVFQLKSSPSLGLEHAAYSINIDNQIIWIDCPSTFSIDVERMDKILFTHHHFLGASNVYRSYFTAFVWIHQKDSENFLAINHSFDKKFLNDFNLSGIEAYHIDGHTEGFTFYIFEDIFFICDYIILTEKSLRFNPYGPTQETIEGAKKLRELINGKDFTKVCGYNYVIDYTTWKKGFEKLLF